MNRRDVAKPFPLTQDQATALVLVASNALSSMACVDREDQRQKRYLAEAVDILTDGRGAEPTPPVRRLGDLMRERKR